MSNPLRPKICFRESSQKSKARVKEVKRQRVTEILCSISHRIHVWYIYLHLVVFNGEKW